MAETGAAADLETSVADPARAGMTTGQRIWAILGGSAGNMVEWYDWFAYSAFSLYFASSFFPKGDETAQLLQAQIANIVSFLARPLGAWLMGRFADRYGRKTALLVSVLMMCVGSLIMACAPTYTQIGIAAPFVLAGARLIQGLSVGGQYGAAATYMSEMATAKRRGFWSSFHYVTLIAGQVLATLVAIGLQKIYPEAEIKAWAWRLAFFIGAGLALLVLAVQGTLKETQSFENAKAAGYKGNTLALFTRYPKETMIIIGLTAAGTSGFYAYTTYMTKFLATAHAGVSTIAHFTKPQATDITLLMLIAFMIAQPITGHLADKFGRKTVMMASMAVSALVAWPVFHAIAAATEFWPAVLLCSAAVVLLSGYTSISAVVKAELFPAHMRALGVALPYALSNAVFGGIAEPAALAWKNAGKESDFYIYIALLMVGGFITAALMRETKTHSLILED
jgi:MHS family alpha-ketoglutarate permease-like MFS transporter